MTIHFDPLIKKKTSYHLERRYNNAVAKEERDVHSNQQIAYSSSEVWSQGSSRKTFFFLKGVKFLGHVTSPEGIQPIAKPVQDKKKFKSPQSKPDLMEIFGWFGFYSCYINYLHVDSERIYDSTKDSTPFYWTQENEKLFQSIKDKISEDTILTVPATD